MPYVRFWHHYAQTHPSSGGPTLDPAALVAVCVCLFALAAWAAFQIQTRCERCGAWPVRCRCAGGRADQKQS